MKMAQALLAILWGTLGLIPLNASWGAELGAQSPPEQIVKAMAELISTEAKLPEDYMERLNGGKKPGDFDPNRVTAARAAVTEQYEASFPAQVARKPLQ